MTHIFPLNQIFVAVLLSLIWFTPSIVNEWTLQVILSLVGSFLLAQLFILVIEWLLIRYGVNRGGISFLSSVLAVVGLAMMYFAWQESNYSMLNIAWIVMYTALGVLHAVYSRSLRGLQSNIILYLEYIFVSLFAAALFNKYIDTSPLSQYALEYNGVGGETVWFIALAVLACEIAYKTYLALYKEARKTVRKITVKK